MAEEATEYGPKYVDSNDVTIGASSAALAVARPKRVRLRIRNTHATQLLYINMDAAATTSNYLIPANGGYVVVTGVGAWNAISNGAGTVAHIIDEYD